MICPTCGSDSEYSTVSQRTDPTGPFETIFRLFCGHAAKFHPKRGEAMEPTTPGVAYEGPVHPALVAVVDPKDAEIEALKAQIASLSGKPETAPQADGATEEGTSATSGAA